MPRPPSLSPEDRASEDTKVGVDPFVFVWEGGRRGWGGWHFTHMSPKPQIVRGSRWGNEWAFYKGGIVTIWQKKKREKNAMFALLIGKTSAEFDSEWWWFFAFLRSAHSVQRSLYNDDPQAINVVIVTPVGSFSSPFSHAAKGSRLVFWLICNPKHIPLPFIS